MHIWYMLEFTCTKRHFHMVWFLLCFRLLQQYISVISQHLANIWWRKTPDRPVPSDTGGHLGKTTDLPPSAGKKAYTIIFLNLKLPYEKLTHTV